MLLSELRDRALFSFHRHYRIVITALIVGAVVLLAGRNIKGNLFGLGVVPQSFEYLTKFSKVGFGFGKCIPIGSPAPEVIGPRTANIVIVGSNFLHIPELVRINKGIALSQSEFDGGIRRNLAASPVVLSPKLPVVRFMTEMLDIEAPANFDSRPTSEILKYASKFPEFVHAAVGGITLNRVMRHSDENDSRLILGNKSFVRQVVGSFRFAYVKKESNQSEKFHNHFRLKGVSLAPLYKSAKTALFLLLCFAFTALAVVFFNGEGSIQSIIGALICLILGFWFFGLAYSLFTNDFYVLTNQVERSEYAAYFGNDFFTGGYEINGHIAHVGGPQVYVSQVSYCRIVCTHFLWLASEKQKKQHRKFETTGERLFYHLNGMFPYFLPLAIAKRKRFLGQNLNRLRQNLWQNLIGQGLGLNLSCGFDTLHSLQDSLCFAEGCR